MTADDDDRRRHPRQRVAASAALETLGSYNPNDQALCSVLNVSRSGIGVETGQPPLCGQKVRLRIALDDEIHEVKTRATRVVRADDSNFYDVGLDWNDCSAEELEFLERVFDAISAVQH